MSSASSSSSVRAAVALVLALLAGCAGRADTDGLADRAAPSRSARVVVFPVENLSAKPAPLGEIRAQLVERLTRRGIAVVDETRLEAVVTKHRVRYTAGVEAAFAKAIGQETGAEAIVIPSLETYDETAPSRVALFARLVTTGETPAVGAIESRGAAGNDTPGLLGLGLIEDPRELMAHAVDAVARTLAHQLAAAEGGGARRAAAARTFQPKLVYRSDTLDPGRTWSVAVVPFFNRSERRYAGEIIALHMMRNLLTFPNLSVVEPGIVRDELLRHRIIMSDGVSLPDTDTILGAVNADLVLNGEVLEYVDPRGSWGTPRVDFSVLFIERKTRRVVFSSYSHNTGEDRVFLYDWGRINTAHAMAAQMARAIAERLVEQR